MRPHSDRRRWWALVTVSLGMFINALDGSIVNVALPAIQRDLHSNQSSLAWVVDAYLITYGSFLLLAGRLGDLVGRKKIFLAGIVVFTLSSVVCGLATSQAVLVTGRFVQGVGGALSTSVIIAIIVTEFPERREQATAMSAFTFVTVGGASIGLLAGGVLTQLLNWHWIFFINVPFGIVTLLLGRILIVENVGLGIRDGVDAAGSVLVTGALMLGIYAVIEVTRYGWWSAHTLLLGGGALVLGGVFLVLESRLRTPIMPLRILRIRTLCFSSVVRGSLVIGMFSVFFFGALLLEGVTGYSPVQTGLAFLPISMSLGVMSLGVTARLVNKFGPKRVLIPGLVCVAGGLLVLTRVPEHPDFVTFIFPAFLLLGLGTGGAFAPLISIAMVDVPKPDAGLGSGFTNVFMQVSAALGLAVLSTLAASRAKSELIAGHSAHAALVAGYRLIFLVAAGCVVVGIVIAVLGLRPSTHLRGGEADAVEGAGDGGLALRPAPTPAQVDLAPVDPRACANHAADRDRASSAADTDTSSGNSVS